MSINQTGVIDFISTAPDGKVILTISDHHSWEEPWHLQLLQDKINSYLQFIEGGQIFEDYPSAIGKDLIIDIVMKEEPKEGALPFLDHIKKIIVDAGFGLEWRVLG
jgi:hypothetical protein